MTRMDSDGDGDGDGLFNFDGKLLIDFMNPINRNALTITGNRNSKVLCILKVYKRTDYKMYTKNLKKYKIVDNVIQSECADITTTVSSTETLQSTVYSLSKNKVIPIY